MISPASAMRLQELELSVRSTIRSGVGLGPAREDVARTTPSVAVFFSTLLNSTWRLNDGASHSARPISACSRGAQVQLRSIRPLGGKERPHQAAPAASLFTGQYGGPAAQMARTTYRPRSTGAHTHTTPPSPNTVRGVTPQKPHAACICHARAAARPITTIDAPIRLGSTL